jgi:hypothetical protein
MGRLVFVEKVEEDEAEAVSNALGWLDLGNAGQTCRIKTLLGELERESVGKRRKRRELVGFGGMVGIFPS